MSVETVQDYWRHPDPSNAPDTYVPDHEPRSRYVADLVAATVPRDARILELGCNVGANLDCLYRHGFRNLSGVEINADAVVLMRNVFPHLDGVRVRRAPIEVFAERMGRYDLVYTMAVLEHLHSESAWVFAKVASRTRWLLTVEDEVSRSWKHFPRNYGDIFTGLGMVERFVEKDLTRVGLDACFVARLFEAV